MFRPSSHKRGLKRFFSIANVQTCGTEEHRVSNSCLCRVLKQSGVKASTFDIIDNFYRGIQHIFQRTSQSSPSKRTSVNETGVYLLL